MCRCACTCIGMHCDNIIYIYCMYDIVHMYHTEVHAHVATRVPCLQFGGAAVQMEYIEFIVYIGIVSYGNNAGPKYGIIISSCVSLAICSCL